MSRRSRPERIKLGDVLRRCRFRTLIGRGGTSGEMLDRCQCTIAILGGDQPDPMDPDMLGEALACLRAGGTVLLIADRADLRDYAKREILALAGPARGAS